MAKKRTRGDLGRKLSKVPGFEEGRALQTQIIRLGDQMRHLREDVLDISQLEAARLIGMNQSELSRIENGVGTRGPSFITITRILDAYQDFLSRRDSGYHLNMYVQVTQPKDEEKQYLIAG